MKNIYAYTGPTPTTGYVGYISINAKEHGIEVSVRSEGDLALTGVINLTPEQCEHLATALLAHINSEPSQASPPLQVDACKVPQGWPTAEMIAAADKCLEDSYTQDEHEGWYTATGEDILRAGLSATPTQVDNK